MIDGGRGRKSRGLIWSIHLNNKMPQCYRKHMINVPKTLTGAQKTRQVFGFWSHFVMQQLQFHRELHSAPLLFALSSSRGRFTTCSFFLFITGFTKHTWHQDDVIQGFLLYMVLCYLYDIKPEEVCSACVSVLKVGLKDESFKSKYFTFVFKNNYI